MYIKFFCCGAGGIDERRNLANSEVVCIAKYEYWISEEGLLRLKDWARSGLNDEEIAAKIGIASSTLYDWKKRFSELSEALKEGKDIPDIKVEDALYESALKGNVTAMIFWLKNRRPGKWRDKLTEAHTDTKEISDFIGLAVPDKETVKDLFDDE